MTHRLHVPDASTGSVSIDGARFHYVQRVLRLAVGDRLEVFDQGRAYTASITAADQASMTLELGPERVASPMRVITIVQGLPKADKLELVLQKATELGASAFAPVSTARSIVKLEGKEGKKLERWQRIVEEAARQSRRNDVPTVFAPRGLIDAVKGLPHAPAVLVLDEEEQAMRLGLAFSALPATRPVALVVGPEGGLTRDEVSALVSLGAVPVTLGRLVLRTETAALAALAILRHLDGDAG
jgi:16S rRNA (uracil1498-N3)-methyltransferase